MGVHTYAATLFLFLLLLPLKDFRLFSIELYRLEATFKVEKVLK